MGVYAGVEFNNDNLRSSFDVSNLKSYPGSGSTLFNLNGNENATGTLSTAIDTTSGTILNHNTSSSIVVNFSPSVNRQAWSLIFWIRSTGLTTSDYRVVIALRDSNSSHQYFYNVDTRQTINSYILGYQKDYNISSWLTTAFNTSTEWANQTWWCLGVSHNNKVFKNYKQGNLFSTQTQTLDVSGYGDLTQLYLNRSGSNTVYMGPVYFYDRILTDDEFRQNFYALRGRFGL